MKPVLLLATLLIALSGSTLAVNKKPNIVFFFVDDMGWQDTSVPFHTERTQLNRDYRTPNMEKLRREGLAFHQCLRLFDLLSFAHQLDDRTKRRAAQSYLLDPAQRHQPIPHAQTIHGCELESQRTTTQERFHSTKLCRNHTPGDLTQWRGYHTIHAGKGHFGAQGTPGADPLNLGFNVNIAGSYNGRSRFVSWRPQLLGSLARRREKFGTSPA